MCGCKNWILHGSEKQLLINIIEFLNSVRYYTLQFRSQSRHRAYVIIFTAKINYWFEEGP